MSGRFLILALATLLTTLANAQENATQNFLFRMAHLEGTNGSCILVQMDGSFHLEKNHEKAAQVFEGTLSADSMTALNDLLNSSSFQQLLPEAISSSLLSTGLDETLLSVPRDGRWMSLRFLSGLSNESNQPLLKQFLKWENSATKSSHKKLREQSGRNNCLPPGQVELKTR